MPSNKDLIAEAERLASALEISVVTDGLKNDALVKLVSDLEAQAGAKAQAGAEKAAAEKAETEARERAEEAAREAEKAAAEKAETEARERAEEAAREAASTKAPVYKVARKNSVTSLRGILDAGTIVSARDFRGGEKSLAELVASGTVVKS